MTTQAVLARRSRGAFSLTVSLRINRPVSHPVVPRSRQILTQSQLTLTTRPKYFESTLSSRLMACSGSHRGMCSQRL
jgi:hypothetical protein